MSVQTHTHSLSLTPSLSLPLSLSLSLSHTLSLTIVHPLFTAVEVPADACGVVTGAQWVLQALDQAAEVVEGLEDLCALIQHG